MVCNQDSVS